MNSPPSAPPLRSPLVSLLPVALGLLLLGMPAAPAAEPEPKPAEEKKPPEVLAEFKIEKGGRPLVLPVTIRGKDHLFVLDTGNSYSVLDASFKPKRGLFDEAPAQTSFTDGNTRMKAEVIPNPGASVGPVKLSRKPVMPCFELRPARLAWGREIRGSIGMDFLKEQIISVDFDNGKLALLPNDDRQHPEWGEPIPLRIDEYGTPLVTGKIEGVGAIDFLVDTGHDAEVVVRSGTLGKMCDAWPTVWTTYLGGAVKERRGRVENLRIGSLDYRRVLTNEGGKDSLLGLGFLSRHAVVFDFPHGRMYLKKGAAFDSQREANMSGLDVVMREKEIVASMVYQETPANQAGIKPDDVILSVNDQPAAGMDLLDLRDLLKSGDGKEIRMTIKRGDEEKAVTFKLKKRI